jgi:hypothetical protein
MLALQRLAPLTRTAQWSRHDHTDLAWKCWCTSDLPHPTFFPGSCAARRLDSEQMAGLTIATGTNHTLTHEYSWAAPKQFTNLWSFRLTEFGRTKKWGYPVLPVWPPEQSCEFPSGQIKVLFLSVIMVLPQRFPVVSQKVPSPKAHTWVVTAAGHYNSSRYPFKQSVTAAGDMYSSSLASPSWVQ